MISTIFAAEVEPLRVHVEFQKTASSLGLKNDAQHV
jgi:hypothetical protein